MSDRISIARKGSPAFREATAELSRFAICKDAARLALEDGRDAALALLDNNRMFSLFRWEMEAAAKVIDNALEAFAAAPDRREAKVSSLGFAIAIAVNQLPDYWAK